MSCLSLAIYTIANRVGGVRETSMKSSQEAFGHYASRCSKPHPWPSETMEVYALDPDKQALVV